MMVEKSKEFGTKARRKKIFIYVIPEMKTKKER